ncbi:MAG: RNA polymerase sigma factor [Jiangellaceae bacterium]
MDDAAIAASMRAKDPAGLAEAYRAYADRLFTYCASMLRDRDAAADAVQDTFVIAAERIGQLRGDDRLRSWLYAIARNECLRIVRVRGRTTALDEAALEGVGAVTDETVDLDSDVRQEELTTLVWTAADGLNPREREVLDLSLRHRLDGPELAAAMGVSTNLAAAVLSTARQQLERALAALIVARTGRRDCVTLDGLLAGWDGAMTVLLRKRVARHIESCTGCTERKRRDVSAAALLGATPMLVAPPALRERVLGAYGEVELVSYHAEIAKRAGRFNRDGFPNPLDMPRMIFGWRAPAVAAAGVAALMVGGMALIGGTTDAALTLTPSPAPSATPTPTPAPTASAPSPSPMTTPAPSATPPPTSPGPETTQPPPSTPEPPPSPDLIVIYCDPVLANECDSLTMVRRQATVWITTESAEPMEILATTTSGWLVVSPSSMVVVPDQPVPISFGSASEPGCPARVHFTIPETDEVERFTVVHSDVPPCITS